MSKVNENQTLSTQPAECLAADETSVGQSGLLPNQVTVVNCVHQALSLWPLKCRGEHIDSQIESSIYTRAVSTSPEKDDQPRCIECGHNNVDARGYCREYVQAPDMPHYHGQYRYCGGKCVFPSTQASASSASDAPLSVVGAAGVVQHEPECVNLLNGHTLCVSKCAFFEPKSS